VSYPHLALTARPHDRHSERRRDEAWLAEHWSDPTARVLAVVGGRVRAVGGAPAWVPSAEAPDGVRVLLGELDERVWWAVLAGEEELDRHDGQPGSQWLELRDLMPGLVEAQDGSGPLLLHAVGLGQWHAVTRFCPRDASPLHPDAAGHELRCAECGRAQFPRTDPAVIMVVATGEPGSAEERCLLGRSPHWPEGRYSTLAGFYEPGESLQDTVRREVGEEVGIDVGEVRYFGNQPWPLPASLMLGFVARAASTDIRVDAVEIEDARWFTRAQMREEAEAGRLVLPGGVSISRSLIEDWYGGPLPGQW